MASCNERVVLAFVLGFILGMGLVAYWTGRIIGMVLKNLGIKEVGK